jgi:hypothetical protein
MDGWIDSETATVGDCRRRRRKTNATRSTREDRRRASSNFSRSSQLHQLISSHLILENRWIYDRLTDARHHTNGEGGEGGDMPPSNQFIFWIWLRVVFGCRGAAYYPLTRHHAWLIVSDFLKTKGKKQEEMVQLRLNDFLRRAYHSKRYNLYKRYNRRQTT